MPTPFVQLIPSSDPAGLPLAGVISRAIDTIRGRAFELFEQRPPHEGSEFQDWLQAERELYEIPEAAVIEDFEGGRSTVRFEVRASAARPLTILVEPQAVTALSFDEQGQLTLWRRIDLAEPVDPLRVSLQQTESTLDVILLRAQPQTAPKTVAAAAGSGGLIAAA